MIDFWLFDEETFASQLFTTFLWFRDKGLSNHCCIDFFSPEIMGLKGGLGFLSGINDNGGFVKAGVDFRF